jgi:hypothetical protein
MQLFIEKKWIWILEFVIIFVLKNVLTHKFTLSSSNARYSDNLVQHLNTSKIQCAILCNCADECTSVNHNADTGVCELTTYVPGVVTPSTETESDWNVYCDGTYPLNYYIQSTLIGTVKNIEITKCWDKRIDKQRIILCWSWMSKLRYWKYREKKIRDKQLYL